MFYKKTWVKVIVLAASLSWLQVAAAGVGGKMAALRELEDAYRGLERYVVEYEASFPDGASMDILVGMDKKSGVSFLKVDRAGTATSKPVKMLSWSLGGAELFMKMNDQVTKITSYDAMLMRYDQLNKLLQPERGMSRPRMASWVMLSPSQMIFSHQMASQTPAWAKEIRELVDLAEQQVTWDAGEMGKLVIDRGTGLLVEQKLKVEAGTRSLKMTRLIKNPAPAEILKMLPQDNPETVRKIEARKSKQGKTINALFFQNLVDRCDREAKNPNLLKNTLNESQERLQNYLKGEDLATKPPISYGFWKQSLEKSVNDINNAMEARGVKAGSSAFFAVEANRKKYRELTVVSMTKEWQGLMRPKIAEYILGEKLKAKTENGQQVITAIEEALERAYADVMIDRSIDDLLKG